MATWRMGSEEVVIGSGPHFLFAIFMANLAVEEIHHGETVNREK